jgi:hypothetical protein
VPITINVTVSEGVAVTRADVVLPRLGMLARSTWPSTLTRKRGVEPVGTGVLAGVQAQAAGARTVGCGPQPDRAGFPDQRHRDARKGRVCRSVTVPCTVMGCLTATLTEAVGAQVTAGPASATSDATGRYTLQQLTPGPTTVIRARET